ncbi:MAG: class I SAM-dependent methyltransferase [Cellvibrionaceae bacterium]
MEGVQSEEVRKKTDRSQSFFNPWLLFLYDFFLFKFISPFLWGCSETSLVNRYKLYKGESHLEVGVGTGYLLSCSLLSDGLGRVSLMDLSEACLAKAAKRLASVNPKIYKRNILNSIEEVEERFDSISINYVMHCVVGDFLFKGVAFRNLKQLLNKDGVLFGVSVLKTDKISPFASAFMWFLNAIGVFNNANDSVEDLESELRRVFKYVDISQTNAAVKFVASDSEAAICKDL